VIKDWLIQWTVN